MNTHEGYSKTTLDNTKILLAGGGDKSFTDFIGSIQYNSTSKTLQYRNPYSDPQNPPSWLNIVTLGARAFDNTAYITAVGNGTGSHFNQLYYTLNGNNNYFTVNYASTSDFLLKRSTAKESGGVQFIVGQIATATSPANDKAYKGSSKDFKVLSFPDGGTVIDNVGTSNETANISIFRIAWNTSYWHDLHFSPNITSIYHRTVQSDTANGWRILVETDGNKGDSTTPVYVEGGLVKECTSYADASVDNADKLDGYHASYFHIQTARSYSSVDAMPSSGTEGWYNIFTINDSTYGAAICTIKAYAHSSLTFIVSKGYSTTSTLQILQYTDSNNDSYFYVKGVRILSDGKVQALFHKTAGTSTNISVTINIFSSTGDLRPNATLTLETGNPTVIAGPLNGTHGKITSDIVGNLTGTATNATNVYIEGASGDVNYPLLFTTSTATGNGRIYADSQWRTAGITFNPSSNTLNVGSKITAPYANHTQTSMRHLDAGLNSVNSDHNLYIGYGAQTYTKVTRFYYSTGTTDSTSSRTEFMQINSNGAYALTRFGVNGQNTSYNFYVNGTSYLSGSLTVSDKLYANKGIDVNERSHFYGGVEFYNPLYINNTLYVNDNSIFEGSATFNNSTYFNSNIYAYSHSYFYGGVEFHNPVYTYDTLYVNDRSIFKSTATFNASIYTYNKAHINDYIDYPISNSNNKTINTILYTATDNDYVRKMSFSTFVTKVRDSGNLDGRYLPLAGGTMAGIIERNAGGSWISGRDNAIIKTTRTSNIGSDWHPAVAVKTSVGCWTFGSVGGETLCFSYDTDANYNANPRVNNSKVIYLPEAGSAGTLALTSDIKNASLTLQINGTTKTTFYANDDTNRTFNVTLADLGAAAEHSHPYLPLAGGTMTGAAPINFTINKIALNFRPDHADNYSKIQYMTAGNEALVFSNKNAVTSFIFKCGYDLQNGSGWNTVFSTYVPTIQLKNQSLYVNTFIASDITPVYNFCVTGIAYVNGSVGNGDNATASGNYSHAEGINTTASNQYSHAEGAGTTASGDTAHAEGYISKATGNLSHAEGYNTESYGYSSHAEGINTRATNQYAHAEGSATTASGDTSHSEGYNTTASGLLSHAEGISATASGPYSHAEGSSTMASGDTAHAEGYNTTASGTLSHAEGVSSKAKNYGSHAEGNSTETNGDYAHSEGQETKANGWYSHAEGFQTIATGKQSHAQGRASESIGEGSFASGYGIITNNEYEAGFGKYNVSNSNTIFSIGGGTVSSRSNLFEVRTDGTIIAPGLFTAASLGSNGNNTTYSVTIGGNTLSGSTVIGYATTAGNVDWSNVNNKPSAVGSTTQPVYWTGSGFATCQAASSLSISTIQLSSTKVYPTLVTGTSSSTLQIASVTGYANFYVTSSGVFFTSDITRKCNILQYIPKINSNPVRKFNWKTGGNPIIGFIAQDVEKWCPEAIDTNDDGSKSLNYNMTLSALCSYLFDKVEKLEKEIENLKMLNSLNKC